MDTLAFECTACNGDYELKVTHFLERPNSLKCPHCGARPSSNRCHTLAQAIDDLLSAMGSVANKVRFELAVANDELPAPYGLPEEEEAAGDLGALGDDEDSDDFEDDDFDDDDDDDDDFDDEDFDDDDFDGDDDADDRY